MNFLKKYYYRFKYRKIRKLFSMCDMILIASFDKEGNIVETGELRNKV